METVKPLAELSDIALRRWSLGRGCLRGVWTMSFLRTVSLVGELVTLEPLSQGHHDGLVEAARDGDHQSRAAIARLGAKQDGVLRHHSIMGDGSLRDTVVSRSSPPSGPESATNSVADWRSSAESPRPRFPPTMHLTDRYERKLSIVA